MTTQPEREQLKPEGALHVTVDIQQVLMESQARRVMDWTGPAGPAGTIGNKEKDED